MDTCAIKSLLNDYSRICLQLTNYTLYQNKNMYTAN